MASSGWLAEKGEVIWMAKGLGRWLYLSFTLALPLTVKKVYHGRTKQNYDDARNILQASSACLH
jgi:hypothetical protein